MARRGPKGRAPDQKKLANDDRPTRKTVLAFPEAPVEQDPDMPASLSEAARAIWARKVTRYRARGQAVAGYEDALAQMCELEAEVEDLRARKIPPTMAQVNALRVWMGEFYDTPASRKVKVGEATPKNRFAKHVRAY